MTGHDPEIEELRDKVHCAVVLEQTPPPWKLDRKESTRLSLKYRRGKGEILIVSHAGRGWWDPTSDAKGDVFGLVQRLEPTLSFGHVRKRLREFAGRYLARERGLPAAIIEAASAAGVLREGPGGSAWFPHLDGHGVVAHVDVRGPTYKGSLTGGAKSLFRLPPKGPPLPRLVLAEAAIDVLSVAAIESLCKDTLYAATGGGMGPGTIAALEGRCSPASQCFARRLLRKISRRRPRSFACRVRSWDPACRRCAQGEARSRSGSPMALRGTTPWPGTPLILWFPSDFCLCSG